MKNESLESIFNKAIKTDAHQQRIRAEDSAISHFPALTSHESIGIILRKPTGEAMIEDHRLVGLFTDCWAFSVETAHSLDQ